jgi:oligosaccharide repeat unit polymerase
LVLRRLSRVTGNSYISFPHFWFLISITYLFLFVPLAHYRFKSYTNALFPGFNWEENLGAAVLTSGIFLNSVFFISSVVFRNSYQDNKYEELRFFKIRTGIIILVFAYSFFGFITWAQSLGGIQALFLTRSELSNSGYQYQNGYLYASLNFGLGAAMIILLKSLYSQKKRSIFYTLLLLLIFILPDLLKGTRVNALFSIVAVLCVYSLFNDSISNKKIFGARKWTTILMGLPVLIVAPRIYRVQESDSLNSIREGFSFKNLFDSFAGFDSAMDIGLSIFLQSNLELGYGKSYIVALLRPIPRTLWAEKPREIDVFFNETIFPATSKYVGFSFSGFSEPIFNFGICGIVILGILTGLLCTVAFMRYRNGSTFYLIVTALLSAFSFNILRGNLSSSYPQIVFPLVASVIVMRSTNNKIDSD